MKLIHTLLFITLIHSFNLQSQNTHDTTVLEYGSNYEGQISSFGEIDEYIFLGEVGDVILIRMRDESKVDAYLKVYNPQGDLVISKWSDGGLAQIKGLVLEETGNYTIEAFDRNHNDTGKYGISLHKLHSNNYARPLPELSSITDSITSITGVNTYTVQINEGDVFFSQMRAKTVHFECDYFMYDSEGNEIYRATNKGRLANIGPVQINKTDTYTISIMDRGGNDLDTYGYANMLLNKHHTAPVINCNSGEVSVINQLANYKYYQLLIPRGKSGCVDMRSLNPRLESRLEIYNSKGESLGKDIKSSQLTSLVVKSTIPENEEEGDSLESFLILVSDKNGNDFGEYGIQVQIFDNRYCINQMSCEGSRDSLHISHYANNKLYVVNGQTGETVNFSLEENSAHMEPHLRLFDDSGNMVAQAYNPVKTDLFSIVYPHSGEFFVLASDKSGNDIGDFTIEAPPEDLYFEMPECVTVYYGFEPLCGADLATGLNSEEYNFIWNTGETTSKISVCPSESQTYSVQITNQSGCSINKEVFVEVLDVTCGNNNNPKIQVCHVKNNGSLNQKCLDEEGVWGHLDNGDGHEECYLGPCEYISICNPESSSPNATELSVRSTDQFINADVFPNPTHDLIQINVSDFSSEKLNLILYDINGRTVYNNTTDSENNMIILSLGKLNLSPGIYSLFVKGENIIMRKPIILLR